jgi:hypothetical protein
MPCYLAPKRSFVERQMPERECATSHETQPFELTDLGGQDRIVGCRTWRWSRAACIVFPRGGVVHGCAAGLFARSDANGMPYLFALQETPDA